MSKQDHINLTNAYCSFGWKDNPVMLYFWIHILFMANTEDTNWHETVIRRGSFVTTIADLSRELNLSVKQVRNCLERLKRGKCLGIDTANNRHLITICDFDSYICQGTDEGQMKGKCPANEKKNFPSLMVPNGSSPDNPSSFTPLLFPQEEIEEGDTAVSPKKSEIDYNYVKKLWNDSMKRKVPKVTSISKSREEKIRQRIAEMGGWEEAKKTMQECFVKINDSEFCNGENENKWVATFDWFFRNEKYWIRVSEGNYDNRHRKTQLEIMAENIKKADAYYEQRYRGYGGASPYGNQTGSGPYGPDEQ